MQYDRKCKKHVKEATFIDLKLQGDYSGNWLCQQCMSQRILIGETVPIDIVEETIENLQDLKEQDQEQLFSLYNQYTQAIKDKLYSFIDRISQVYQKIIENVKQLDQQLNKVYQKEDLIEFIQKYYKGKYLFEVTPDNHQILLIYQEGLIEKVKEQLDNLRLSEQNSQIMNLFTEMIRKISNSYRVHTQKVQAEDLDSLNLEELQSYLESHNIKIVEQRQQLDVNQQSEIDKMYKVYQIQLQDLKNEVEIKGRENQIKIQAFKLRLDSSRVEQIDIQKHDLEIQKKIQEMKQCGFNKLEDIQNQITLLSQLKQELVLEKENYYQYEILKHSKQIYSIEQKDQGLLCEFGKNLIPNNSKFESLFQLNSQMNHYQETKEIQNFITACSEFNELNPKLYQMLYSENKLIDPKLIVFKKALKEKKLPHLTLEDYMELSADITKSPSIEQIESYYQNKIMMQNDKNQLDFYNQYHFREKLQLIFYNSTSHLQTILLRQQFETQPIKLLYLNLNFDKVNDQRDFYCLNDQIYYIFPQCYPIINLSLSKKQSIFGKSDLINQIFYSKKEIFQVNNNCDLNHNTIDIMFNTEIEKIKKYAIADVHGQIPINLLIKILPLFKFWIIQINTEEEFEENKSAIDLISQKINIPSFCILIRNSKNYKFFSQSFSQAYPKAKIIQIIDLTIKNIVLDEEISSVKNQIFKLIIQDFQQTQQTQQQQQIKQEFIDSSFYFNIVIEFYFQNPDIIRKLDQDREFLSEFNKKFQKQINDISAFNELYQLKISKQQTPFEKIIFQNNTRKFQEYFQIRTQCQIMRLPKPQGGQYCLLQKNDQFKIENKFKKIELILVENLKQFRIQNNIDFQLDKTCNEKLKQIISQVKLTNLQLLQEAYENQKKEFYQQQGYIQFPNNRLRDYDQFYQEQQIKLMNTKCLHKTQTYKEQLKQFMTNEYYKRFESIYKKFEQCQYHQHNEISFNTNFVNLQSSNTNQSEKIKNMFLQAITSSQCFTIISNNFRSQKKYFNIFLQPIESKFVTKSTDLINLRDDYEYISTFYIISNENVRKYFREQFLEDFLKFKKENQNVESQQLYEDFFQVFKIFQVDYNIEKYNALMNYLINGHNWYYFFYGTKSYCKELIETFQFKPSNIDISSIFDLTQFQLNCPQLQLQSKFLIFESKDQFISKCCQLSKDNHIFIKEKMISPKQNNDSQIFEFLCRQNENQDLRNRFQENIVRLVQQKMNSQWKSIIDEIYVIIEQIINKNRIFNEITDLDEYEVQIIFSALKQKIKEYNKCFANFGVIFSKEGKKVIYYHSILFIWNYYYSDPFQFFKQRCDSYEQQMQSKYQLQNNQNKDIQNARAIAANIKQCFLDQFYMLNKSKIKKQIEDMNQTSQQLVRQLDDLLIFQVNNTTYKENTLKYITDQKKYIQNHIDYIIKQKYDELKKNYQEELSQKLKEFLIQVKYNIQKILKIVEKNKNYQVCDNCFKPTKGALINIYRQKQLFYLIAKCIQGTKIKQSELEEIQKDCKPVFLEKYYSLEISLIWKVQKKQMSISNLLRFIIELHKEINQFIQITHQEVIQMKRLEVSDKFNSLKLLMMGCQSSCPICNRKCDESCSKSHQHVCHNGHFIGQEQIQLNIFQQTKHKPQKNLVVCENLNHDTKLKIQELQVKLSWTEIKNTYTKWDFKTQNDGKVKHLEQKLQQILGNQRKFLTSGLNLGNQSFYLQGNNLRENLSEKSIHFIFFINNFQINNLQNVKNFLHSCIKGFFKYQKVRISLITVSNNYQILIDCQNATDQLFNDQNQVKLTNQQCNYEKAFNSIQNQVQRYQLWDFSKTIVLFYSETNSLYTENALQNLQLLSQKSILLFLYTTIKDYVLGQIMKNLQQNQIETKLQETIKIDELYKILKDELFRFNIQI